MYFARTEAIETKNELIMLHRIKPGIALNSHGVQIAQMAGLPQDVIESAKSFQKQQQEKILKKKVSNWLEE